MQYPIQVIQYYADELDEPKAQWRESENDSWFNIQNLTDVRALNMKPMFCDGDMGLNDYVVEAIKRWTHFIVSHNVGFTGIHQYANIYPGYFRRRRAAVINADRPVPVDLAIQSATISTILSVRSIDSFLIEVTCMNGHDARHRNTGIVFLAAKAQLLDGCRTLRTVEDVRARTEKSGSYSAFMSLPYSVREQALQGHLGAVLYILGITSLALNVPITPIETTSRAIANYDGLLLLNSGRQLVVTGARSAHIGVTVNTAQYATACRNQKLLPITIVLFGQDRYRLRVSAPLKRLKRGLSLALQRTKEWCQRGHVSIAHLARYLGCGSVLAGIAVAISGYSLKRSTKSEQSRACSCRKLADVLAFICEDEYVARRLRSALSKDALQDPCPLPYNF